MEWPDNIESEIASRKKLVFPASLFHINSPWIFYPKHIDSGRKLYNNKYNQKFLVIINVINIYPSAILKQMRGKSQAVTQTPQELHTN